MRKILLIITLFLFPTISQSDEPIFDDKSFKYTVVPIIKNVKGQHFIILDKVYIDEKVLLLMCIDQGFRFPHYNCMRLIPTDNPTVFEMREVVVYKFRKVDRS